MYYDHKKNKKCILTLHVMLTEASDLGELLLPKETNSKSASPPSYLNVDHLDNSLPDFRNSWE